MSTRVRIDVRLPPELVERVDREAERLGQTRTKFIERSLSMALGVVQGQEPVRTGEWVESLDGSERMPSPSARDEKLEKARQALRETWAR